MKTNSNIKNPKQSVKTIPGALENVGPHVTEQDTYP